MCNTLKLHIIILLFQAYIQRKSEMITTVLLWTLIVTDLLKSCTCGLMNLEVLVRPALNVLLKSGPGCRT